MKVLHVTPYYLPATQHGGPVRVIHGLCASLAQRGHEVRVLATAINGCSDSKVPLGAPVDLDGVKIWYFRSRHFRSFYFSEALENALSAQAKDCDLIHIHSIFTWPACVAARIARRFKIPYLVSPHGMLVKDLIQRKNRLLKTLWLKGAGKRIFEKAAGIHMTSELEAREAKSFSFKLPPVFVIPFGVDDEILSSPSVQKMSPAIERAIGETPFLLFLGRVNWKNGLDRLIPALAYVPEAHLVIAGNDEENYQPNLEKLAETHNVRHRITFIGPVYGEEKISLLKAASVFVLPSYSENFGVAVLEAMAVGCPVVVTPEVGLADVVEKAGAGRVVNGDSKILGESLGDMIKDPASLKKMGEAGRQAVLDQFRWDIVAKQVEEIYQKVLLSK